MNENINVEQYGKWNIKEKIVEFYHFLSFSKKHAF